MKTIVIRGVRVSVPNRFVVHREGVRFIAGVMYVPNEEALRRLSRQTTLSLQKKELFSLHGAISRLIGEVGKKSSLEEALSFLQTGSSKEKQKPVPKWRKATKEECARYNRIEGQLARRCVGIYASRIQDLDRQIRAGRRRLTQLQSEVFNRERALSTRKALFQKTIEALTAPLSQGK